MVTFAQPQDVGPRLNLQDLLGHVVVLKRTGEPESIETQYGTKTRLDCEVLDVDNDADGWMPLSLLQQGPVSRMRKESGLVLAKVTRPGQGYVLDEKAVKPAERKRAEASVKTHGE